MSLPFVSSLVYIEGLVVIADRGLQMRLSWRREGLVVAGNYGRESV